MLSTFHELSELKFTVLFPAGFCYAPCDTGEETESQRNEGMGSAGPGLTRRLPIKSTFSIPKLFPPPEQEGGQGADILRHRLCLTLNRGNSM